MSTRRTRRGAVDSTTPSIAAAAPAVARVLAHGLRVAVAGLALALSAPLPLDASPSARDRFPEHVMDGQVRAAHPRILMPELETWRGRGPPALIVERAAEHAARGEPVPDPCALEGVHAAASCYLKTGHDDDARRLRAAIDRHRTTRPRASARYGNAWVAALGYDILRLSPVLSREDRQRIETRLRRAVEELLALLDGDAAALWHGRASLAASAWICAVVLDPRDPAHAELQRRAQAHFADTLAALEVSEAWPEGYSYWINERALLLALAGAAYVNGLRDADAAGRVREALRRSAYWTIYATRPDHRVEGLGDEGPRVDLKDETRRVIDVIAQLTRDPVIAGYSSVLRRLHGAAAYYSSYRGQFLLFNDPSVPVSGEGSLASVAARLPLAELFGPGATNLAIIRSGWGESDTFITFRAGATMAHHGHYDAGHFSVFKLAPLAVNSSTYTRLTDPHRLYYAARSVAKNTVLVLRPGETVQPNELFELNVADGGQRLTLPTGSSIDSLESWRRNLHTGHRLAGAEIERFESGDDHVYIRADLAPAYDRPGADSSGRGGKVRTLVRELLYLRAEDRLLVHDQLEVVDPGFVKKWLLHTIHRPQVEGLRTLVGTPDDGILESRADVARIVNGAGELTLTRLFPADALMRVVGGPHYRFYVEIDGDESELDGVSFAQGASAREWFDQAGWRIEIQPSGRRAQERFLVALTPRARGSGGDGALARVESREGDALGVVSSRSMTLFVPPARSGAFTLDAARWPARLRLVGVPPSARVSVRHRDRFVDAGGGRTTHVRELALPQGLTGELTVLWR